MVTTVTKTVGTGGDYTTWQGAEDAVAPISNSLVTDDQVWFIKGKNQEFTGAAPLLVHSGVTTDATRFVTFQCDTGASYYDNANKLTNALAYNSANGCAIRTTSGGDKAIKISCDYTVIDGLMVKDGTANGAFSQTGSCANAVIKDCILYSANTTTSVGVVQLTGMTAVNCLSVQTASSGSGIVSSGSGSKSRNCISVCTNATPATNAYSKNYDSPLVINCIGMGFGAFGNGGGGSWNSSSDYNLTDKSSTTSTGTHNLVSKTFANQFQNVTAGTEDFRIKAGADAINAGSRDATNTADLDIVKQSRSTTTPTIGAWEYIAAGATGKLFMIGSLNGLGSGGPFFHNGDR